MEARTVTARGHFKPGRNVIRNAVIFISAYRERMLYFTIMYLLYGATEVAFSSKYIKMAIIVA